jgi:hypothetical protein
MRLAAPRQSWRVDIRELLGDFYAQHAARMSAPFKRDRLADA